ncbi:MAG TPA: glycosyltransferase family 1 protein, partial [Longimicrobium sp.]
TDRNRHLFETTLPNFRLVVCPIPAGLFEVYRRVAWEYSVLRWRARLDGLDLMHFPGNLVPPAFPVPTVLTVHDFSSQFYREILDEVPTAWIERVVGSERVPSCHRADWLISISDFTRREILARTRVDPLRVRTVLLTPRKFEVPSLEDARERVGTYGVVSPFVLSVATLSPHKNLRRLVEAFALVSSGPLSGRTLVLVGKPGRGGEAGAIRERIAALGLQDRVVLPGYVPDHDLPAFYRAAELYVFPSLYEGFGLPLLEAAACGTPVAAARAGALPEVGDDAAVYFDPYDPADIALAMSEIVTSPALRAGLAERGPARAGLFTAQRTALDTIEVYRSAAARRGPPARRAG